MSVIAASEPRKLSKAFSAFLTSAVKARPTHNSTGKFGKKGLEVKMPSLRSIRPSPDKMTQVAHCQIILSSGQLWEES